MKKYLSHIRHYFLFAVIAVGNASCSKEPATPTGSGTTIYQTPPPPPPPPPPPSLYSPYAYYQMPTARTGSFVLGDTTYNGIDFREKIFDSNSMTAAGIDSVYIQEVSGLIYHILETPNSSGFWYEEALESWLPGWEYKWFIRIKWKGRTNNSPFAANPPNGRLIVRFR